MSFYLVAGGLSHVHPHQLRHTLATQAINRSMSLEAIAALLGHKSMSMTMTYANPRVLHQKSDGLPDTRSDAGSSWVLRCGAAGR
jgi:integrase